MSKKKGDKIRRLRKAHVWPSVIFLAFCAPIAIVAIIVFVAIMMGFLVQDRTSVVFTNAISINEAVVENSRGGRELLSGLPSGNGYIGTVLIADKDGNIVEGSGEATFNSSEVMDKIIIDELLIGGDLSEELNGGNYKIRHETKYKGNLISKEGNLDMINVLIPENFSKFYSPDNKYDTVLFRAMFWLDCELDGDLRTMIQCIVPFYFKDFLAATIMGGIAFALMLIPIIFLFVNIILNVNSQKRMTKLLYTDTVTEGASFMCFENTANKALTTKTGKLYAIADVTLIKYRSFCNYHGAQAGEQLLADVDKEIKGMLSKKELCAHSGKSSFAVLMECPDKSSGEQRVTSMVNELSQKFRHGGIMFHAGIYFAEPGRVRSTADAADCFNRAGAARATLTDDNTPSVAVYDDKLLEEQLWEHKVEEKMQEALDNEEFRVFVQPKYDPATEKLAGAEALVRWINDEDGFISPGRFIPIFEKNGFITKLDDYMLAHVAQLQSQWLSEGKDVVPVSVNVSRAHFANPDLAQHICGIVDKYNVPHRLIEIELTESAFFDDKAALLKTVHELSELGFEISMDDFGAGYSSLNSLKDLPLDVLKLDAEFFRGESDEDRGEIVVAQAISLAKKLNMRIVAEGVEKKEQVDFLAGQGCDMIQGFYFAKPMPANEYAQRLTPDSKAFPDESSAPQADGKEQLITDKTQLSADGAQEAPAAEPAEAPAAEPAEAPAQPLPYGVPMPINDTERTDDQTTIGQ